jgi:23S rRNA (cytosine1962-C5)-methyltransferase
MNEVILKEGKERSLFRYHPWIFSGAIDSVTPGTSEGDTVKVYDRERRFLAVGHYQVRSIAVRVLSFEEEDIDSAFWTKRVKQAYRARVAVGLAHSDSTNIYRLVHGEGDGLPGLIVDVYAGVAVMQCHSVGMFLARAAIAQALVEVMGDRLVAVYDKSEGTLPAQAGLHPKNGYLQGSADSALAIENGLTFNVDWVEGQKTGFFVDQRESRVLLERYAGGRNVLNLFCYTGGFSCYAMRGGADLVHSVDVSVKAIELTRENVARNFPNDDRHEAFAEDAFKFLEGSRGLYDLIVLDPPAFAKHQNALENAVQGYRKLNRKGIEVLRPGGLLFTFSCSQVMTRELFRQTVFSAAANTGRDVKILHQLAQPADHPVSIYHPEGEYLKGLVLYAE